jgi:hypothetical protein
MFVFQFKRILIRLFCLEHELLLGEWVQTLYRVYQNKETSKEIRNQQYC